MKPLQSGVVLLFSVACGLAVGNVYYAQPLLDAMAEAFGMSPASIGIVITLTQIGYGIGLVLLVPLGDLFNRRRLIVSQTLLSAAALLMIALAPDSVWLLLGMTLTGLLAVVTQVLVAYAATLASRHSAGVWSGWSPAASSSVFCWHAQWLAAWLIWPDGERFMCCRRD